MPLTLSLYNLVKDEHFQQQTQQLGSWVCCFSTYAMTPYDVFAA
ncbi:hypothetical protein L910_4766 [Vibrio fluvialis PG41]|uniref:Uncharacterized protein n=1 Tax=Vibrio fluvialis PG41 TaxID=1336752 RepID=S7I3B2_VIBFL|nr:hypothetical protein L910_4766 [Vibrio fluvialis PG41]